MIMPDVQRYRSNLQGEVDGEALYSALAEAEIDPNLASAFRKLSSVESAHASSGAALSLPGAAGLVAGSCSMAMGEWLSVNSARELYARQIATEAAELEQSPEEEQEELVLIYQAKGIPEAHARALARRLLSDKTTALD